MRMIADRCRCRRSQQKWHTLSGGIPDQAQDGREVWLNDTPCRAGQQYHPVMEGIIVDITERKQLETQLQQSVKWSVGRLAASLMTSTTF